MSVDPRISLIRSTLVDLADKNIRSDEMEEVASSCIAALDSVAADLSQLQQRAESAEKQLAAVDENLPEWEPAPGENCVGRVQTILNLKADRAERDTALRALERIASDATLTGSPGVLDKSFSGREAQAMKRVARDALDAIQRGAAARESNKETK